MMMKVIHSINTVKRLKKKKILCVSEVDSSEETNSDSSGEDEVNKFMLMAIDDIGNECI